MHLLEEILKYILSGQGLFCILLLERRTMCSLTLVLVCHHPLIVIEPKTKSMFSSCRLSLGCAGHSQNGFYGFFVGLYI